MSEIDCFATALTLLLKTKTSKEIFKPVDENGISQAEVRAGMFREFKNATEKAGKGTFPIKDKLEEYDPDTDCRFPFMLAMCGSGVGFIRVEENGHYMLAETSNIGGRFFLGLISFMTGVTDFTEIAKLIEESDGKTVDMFGSDLLDPSLKGEKSDLYSSINDDLRIFAFGKGLTDDKDKATKGDLIHSLLESVSEDMVRVVAQAAEIQKVPRVYFCGNFVNTPKAQMFITRQMHEKRYWQGLQVNFEFIKNGGFLGAIGAFIEAYDVQKKAEIY